MEKWNAIRPSTEFWTREIETVKTCGGFEQYVWLDGGLIEVSLLMELIQDSIATMESRLGKFVSIALEDTPNAERNSRIF